MQIVIDVDVDPSGRVGAHHVVETARLSTNKVQIGSNPDVFQDAIDFINDLHTGKRPLAGTGWDKKSLAPLQAGKTLLDAFRAEIVRLNDTDSRKLLGL